MKGSIQHLAATLASKHLPFAAEEEAGFSTTSMLFTVAESVKEEKNSKAFRPAFQFLILQGVLCWFWRHL